MTITHDSRNSTQNFPQIELRLAKRGDEPGVASMIQKVYEEFGFPWDEHGYCADMYDLQHYYLDRGDLFWVAESQGVIIGSAGLEFFPTIEGDQGSIVLIDGIKRIAGTDCELHRLYLAKEFRGQGLGRILFETTLQAAKEHSKTSMQIWSDKRLDSAHKMYQRYGATIVGERLCNDPEQAPEWGLMLPIK